MCHPTSFVDGQLNFDEAADSGGTKHTGILRCAAPDQTRRGSRRCCGGGSRAIRTVAVGGSACGFSGACGAARISPPAAVATDSVIVVSGAEAPTYQGQGSQVQIVPAALLKVMAFQAAWPSDRPRSRQHRLCDLAAELEGTADALGLRIALLEGGVVRLSRRPRKQRLRWVRRDRGSRSREMRPLQLHDRMT